LTDDGIPAPVLASPGKGIKMTVRVGLGLGSAMGISANDYWRWIDLCEQGGIDSIWHSDQLLGDTLEPMSLMSALAARTSRMRFGTSALVAPFRDPVVLAKQIATIDFIGQGRLLPVFGVGNASDPYWTATGGMASERGARANEGIELVRALLGQDHVDFTGRFHAYRGPGMKPRPAKRIPLWIGGNTEAAFRRTARLGDGWLGSMIAPSAAQAARSAIEAELVACGRMIDPDHYGMTLMVRIGDADDPVVEAARKRLAARLPDETKASAAHILLAGPPADVVAALRQFVDAGISKFVLMPMAQDAAGLMAQTKAIAGEVNPAIES
jgi:probable F420-dependent oxidoreductase